MVSIVRSRKVPTTTLITYRELLFSNLIVVEHYYYKKILCIMTMYSIILAVILYVLNTIRLQRQ
eukprot:COSAG05_NODE_390_length_10436_cov_15.721196_4_plen_64_part_00